MHCDLCGTKVKVVGDKTKHYEPVVDRQKVDMVEIDSKCGVLDEIYTEFFDCPSCENTVTKGSNFCRVCGKKIKWI